MGIENNNIVIVNVLYVYILYICLYNFFCIVIYLKSFLIFIMNKVKKQDLEFKFYGKVIY